MGMRSAELRLSHVLQTYLWGLNIHEAPQIAKAFHRLYTQRTFEPGPALGKHFHLTQSLKYAIEDLLKIT